MSKKKRLRKDIEEGPDLFMNVLVEAIVDARDFLAEASPFEISLELAQLGVALTYEAGIREFLLNYKAPANDLEPQLAFEALGEHWEKEIEQKRGSHPDLEDCVFLTEVARYYWLKMQSPG